MSFKTIQTYRNLGRRSSVYALIDSAEAIKNMKFQLNKNNDDNITRNEIIDASNQLKTAPIKNNKPDNLSVISQSSISSASKPPSSVSKSSTVLNEIRNSGILPYNHKSKTHYLQNRLPVLTSSQRILTELSEVSKKNDYYKKFIGENNFGKKYVEHNLFSKEYEKNKRFLNDEEKNPISLIDNKKFVIDDKAKIIRDQKVDKNNDNNFLLFKNSKILISKRSSFLNKIINKTENDIKNETKKIQSKSFGKSYFISKNFTKIFDYSKNSEFSHLLITNFLKKTHPSISNKKLEKFLNKKYNKNLNEKRYIYVIKDSSVITNAQIIPGFFAQIPSKNFLKNLSIQKRLFLVKQFCEFASNKFRSNVKLKTVYDRKGNEIVDFIGLPENEKYIFISASNSFHGISISYNKRITKLYHNLFLKKKINKYYFNESSFNDSINYPNYNTENNNIFEANDESNTDDIFDLYFNYKKNKIKKFKKIKSRNEKITKNFSFTFGIEDEKYKYVIYSEDENRKRNIEKNIFNNCKKKIDYFVELENTIYENKLNNLLSKLSTNKHSTKKLPSNKELMDAFLTEKKIPKKNMLKHILENKPLNPQDIIDYFKILKSTDPSMDINKFYLKNKKAQKKNTPYVEKNIDDNSDKYLVNRNKINKEYPSILSYNLPMVVDNYPKYSLNDLIKYYTKFKSLVNLWLNMHHNLKVIQCGIDFETFYNCTNELCNEEINLVKKIYDTINSGASGILSLEDYVDALNTLNRNDLMDQFEFFLKVFDAKDKKYLSYSEILQISNISIKRLIKSKDDEDKENLTQDLSEFFASFIFRICSCKPTEGLEIKKFRELLLNDKKNMEYLKLFLCSFGEEKTKNSNNESKSYNPINEIKKLNDDLLYSEN